MSPNSVPNAATATVAAEGRTRQRRGAGDRVRSLTPGLRRLRTWGPLLILAALCVIFAVASPRFLTVDNLQTIANQSAIPIVLVCGLTFIVIMGSIDLSLEGAMAVTSVVSALLIANDVNGSDLGYLAVLIGVGLGLLFGLVNGLLYTKLRLPSLLVTVGTWFVGLGIAALLFPARQPRISDGSLRAWSLDTLLGVSRLVFVALACVLVAYLLQRYTKFGRYCFAIGGGEDTARLSGLPLDRVKVAAFGFAGLMAGLAGVMATTRLGVGSVEAGEGLLFPTISAIVIGGTLLSGGRGGILHSLVGVLILGVLSNGMVLVGVDAYVQQAVQGAIIIVAVVLTTWHARSRMRVIK